jgi:hypothetical protein
LEEKYYSPKKTIGFNLIIPPCMQGGYNNFSLWKREIERDLMLKKSPLTPLCKRGGTSDTASRLGRV